MTPDMINALITLAMCAGASLNIYKLYQDKDVKGIHWAQPTISTLACLYSVVFCWSLEQWYSVVASSALSILMIIWVCGIFYNMLAHRLADPR